MLQARSGTREGVRGGGGKGLPCHVAVGLRSGCGRVAVGNWCVSIRITPATQVGPSVGLQRSISRADQACADASGLTARLGSSAFAGGFGSLTVGPVRAEMFIGTMSQETGRVRTSDDPSSHRHEQACCWRVHPWTRALYRCLYCAARRFWACRSSERPKRTAYKAIPRTRIFSSTRSEVQC